MGNKRLDQCSWHRKETRGRVNPAVEAASLAACFPGTERSANVTGASLQGCSYLLLTGTLISLPPSQHPPPQGSSVRHERLGDGTTLDWHLPRRSRTVGISKLDVTLDWWLLVTSCEFSMSVHWVRSSLLFLVWLLSALSILQEPPLCSLLRLLLGFRPRLLTVLSSMSTAHWARMLGLFPHFSSDLTLAVLCLAPALFFSLPFFLVML